MEKFLTEKDLVYYIVKKSNPELSPHIPLVYKGIASTAKKILKKSMGGAVGGAIGGAIGALSGEPVIMAGIGGFIGANVTDFINSRTQKAFMNSLSDDSKNLQENNQLKKVLIDYYNNMYYGDDEGNKFNKQKALAYYKDALMKTFVLEDEYKNCFEKNMVNRDFKSR